MLTKDRDYIVFIVIPPGPSIVPFKQEAFNKYLMVELMTKLINEHMKNNSLQSTVPLQKLIKKKKEGGKRKKIVILTSSLIRDNKY